MENAGRKEPRLYFAGDRRGLYLGKSMGPVGGEIILSDPVEFAEPIIPDGEDGGKPKLHLAISPVLRHFHCERVTVRFTVLISESDVSADSQTVLNQLYDRTIQDSRLKRTGLVSPNEVDPAAEAELQRRLRTV